MTPEAATILQSIHSINYQEKKLQRTLKTHKGNFLTLGATKTIGEYVIAHHVEHFLRNIENQISIEIDNTKRILNLLDYGEIDFALVEGYFDSSQYESRLYQKENFVGFCSKNHPFADRIITLKELFRENIIVREKGSGTRSILEQLLQEKNHSLTEFSRVTSIGNFRLLQHLVTAGCGITFAYRSAGKTNDNITTFQVDTWNITREFYYVFLPNTFARQMVELFEGYR